MILSKVSCSENNSDPVFMSGNTYDSAVGHEVGGWHHLECAGPEPSIDVDGLEVSGLAAFDLLITESSGSVDVLDAGGPHQADDEFLLGLGLQADHVHAHLSAVVAAGEPVPTGVPQDQLVAGPGDPVTLLVVIKVSD